MEGVAARVPKRSEGVGVKPSLTANGPVVRAVEREPMQLALPLPVADVTLAEHVWLWGKRRMHAVPYSETTARRLGLGWPTRTFCERPAVAHPGDLVCRTDDPDDVECQACLRSLRQAGLLR